ncbi:uncharacterized protein N7518_009019 [Penicillium psychrosexuale]|uniref:uncharacterized protein n=1 Tax=Penicillium psychrosexuale TaxID=1002107 RepID=UPI002545910A|nr:uncharacterized protein N7518_009019 [Penicillium psychrosexuale]KAJ5783342.1 hypothetical protein N7518_009019 [Penicillium psychrosexuale]
MTVAVGSKAPLILQIPQLAHLSLLFFFHPAYPLPRIFGLLDHLPFLTALLFYSAFVCTDPVSSNCNYPFPSTGLHALHLLTRCT